MPKSVKLLGLEMWKILDGMPPSFLIQAPDTDDRVCHWQSYCESGAFGLPDRLNWPLLTPSSLWTGHLTTAIWGLIRGQLRPTSSQCMQTPQRGPQE